MSRINAPSGHVRACIPRPHGRGFTPALGNAFAGPSLGGIVIRDTYRGNALLVHELGHILGVQHNASTSSIMFPRTNLPGQKIVHADLRQATKALPDTNAWLCG